MTALLFFRHGSYDHLCCSKDDQVIADERASIDLVGTLFKQRLLHDAVQNSKRDEEHT